MGYIAEFESVSPVMRETVVAVPSIELRTEQLHVTPEGEGQFVFWASCDDFDNLESALRADSTIKDYHHLATLDDRRLYRVTLSAEGRKGMTYPVAAEYDIQFLETTTTPQGSQTRARIPSRDALRAYREACEEQGLSFRLQRLYREAADDPTQAYGLTEKQYDALVRAHELGYFDTPRRISLEELAGEFEVSPSALGRRLRRAQDTLIWHTLRSDD